MRPIVQIERNDSDERFRDKVNSNFMTLAQDDRIGVDTKRKSLVDSVNTYADNAASQAVSDFVETVLPGVESGLQEQIDGKVESFFTIDHTADPGAAWTPAEQTAHTGDLWYNEEDGFRLLKRWSGTAWVLIQDQDAIDAFDAANDAQDTADGKRTVFTTEPFGPYFIGDLWLTSLLDGEGDIKKCINANIVIGSYLAADWVLASKYTDDSALDTFISEVYDVDIPGLQGQIDGKVESFFTTDAADPSTGWTAQQKIDHTGDLWYNEQTGAIFLKRWSGSTWTLVQDQDALDAMEAASDAQDTADGKRTIFTIEPFGPYFIGDLWLTSLVDGEGDIYKCIGDQVTGYDPLDWVLATKYTDDSAHPDLLDEAERYTDITSGEAKATPYYTPLDSTTVSVAMKVTLARKVADAEALHGRLQANPFFNSIDVGAENAEYSAAFASLRGMAILTTPLNEVTVISDSDLNTYNSVMSAYYSKLNAFVDKLALFFVNSGGTVLVDGVGLKVGTINQSTGLYEGANMRLTTTELQFRYNEEVKVDVGDDETYIVNATLAGDTLVTEKITLPDQIDISTLLSIQKIDAGLNINFI